MKKVKETVVVRIRREGKVYSGVGLVVKGEGDRS